MWQQKSQGGAREAEEGRMKVRIATQDTKIGSEGPQRLSALGAKP